MSDEATSLLSHEPTLCEQIYRTVQTLHDIEVALHAHVTAGVPQFALVAITLQFVVEGTPPSSEQMLTQSIQYYLEVLRRLVRKTDVVYRLDNTFYFLLFGANEGGGHIVQTRLWDALLWRVHNSSEGDSVRPRVMGIGHAAYPAPYASLHDLLIAANEVCNSVEPEKSKVLASPRKDKEREQEKTVVEQEQEEDLTVLARRLGLPYLSLLPRKKTEQVQRLVTLQLAHELQCYPLGRERGMLTVAFSNPQDNSTLERLQQATGLRIFPVLTHPVELQTALSLLV